MKIVKFNENGGPITAKAVFLGKIVTNYGIYLRENNSNAQTALLQGDNTNPEDDSISLPSPALSNNGRRVVLETGFYGLDSENFSDYEIRLEIYQDNIMIGFDNDFGKLTGKGQYSLLYILLTK